MTTFANVIPFRRDSEAKERRTAERREHVAERIARRQLALIQADNYANTVKGGRFGLDPTTHDHELYELVAQRLLEHEIEIKVHEISQQLPGDPDNAKHPVRQVVSVATLKGWEKYIPQTPTAHPEVFMNAFGPLGYDALLITDQIYPPPEPGPLAA